MIVEFDASSNYVLVYNASSFHWKYIFQKQFKILSETKFLIEYSALNLSILIERLFLIYWILLSFG